MWYYFRMSTETGFADRRIRAAREDALAEAGTTPDWEALYRELSQATDLLAITERWEEQQNGDNPGGEDFHNAELRDRVLTLLSQTPCED